MFVNGLWMWVCFSLEQKTSETGFTAFMIGKQHINTSFTLLHRFTTTSYSCDCWSETLSALRACLAETLVDFTLSLLAYCKTGQLRFSTFSTQLPTYNVCVTVKPVQFHWNNIILLAFDKNTDIYSFILWFVTLHTLHAVTISQNHGQKIMFDVCQLCVDWGRLLYCSCVITQNNWELAHTASFNWYPFL